MTDEHAGGARHTASELVKKVSTEMKVEVSEATLETIVDAFEQDMASLAHRANDDEERLSRGETRTQVLADITKGEETLAPAAIPQRAVSPPSPASGGGEGGR